MAEIRPAASLTSGLLARRGDARPAMRRQAITHLHVPLAAQDDLGWNDVGDEQDDLPPVTSLSAMTPLDGGYDEQDEFEGQESEDSAGGLSPMTRHLEAIAQRITSAVSPAASFKAAMAASTPAPQKAGEPRKPKAAPGLSGRKAAFTLRLDGDRHLRLRLLSALQHRSSQQLLIEALDALLARHDKVLNLAGQVGAVDALDEDA